MGQWLEDSVRGSVRIGTYERYESISRVRVVPALRKRLLDLTEMDVQGPLQNEAGEAVASPRTAHYIHVTLQKTLKQAVRWKLVPRTIMPV